MPGPPQDIPPLAALSPAARARALERYRLLQPCVEHDVPLTHVARHHGIPLRTAQRWLAQYRGHGLAGLTRRERRDRGHPHGLPPELTQMIEGLALRTPPHRAYKGRFFDKVTWLSSLQHTVGCVRTHTAKEKSHVVPGRI